MIRIEQFQTNPTSFIERTIREFIVKNPKNYFQESKETLFDEPLIGFADGDDPIFQNYKQIIGDFYLTPREALERYCLLKGEKFYEQPTNISVIVWILPISYQTRLSMRKETVVPSLRWNHARWHCKEITDEFDAFFVSLFEKLGHKAVAPMSTNFWEKLELANGPAGNWSHRHAAYAAGLGTFSLSDAFISEKGIATRMDSIICDLALPHTPRKYSNHLSNCLFYRDGTCKKCIERCPVGAISEKGHDKKKCRDFCFVGQKEILKILGRTEGYGSDNPGCGFCLTDVPCEFRIPF